MNKFLKLTACSALAIAGLSITAQASSISSVVAADSSAVVIDRAGIFYEATDGSAIEAQDRIIALNDATANVALSPSCSVLLNSNQAMTVLSTTATSCDAMYSIETLTAGDLDSVGASYLGGGSDSSLLKVLLGFGLVAGGVIAAESNDSPNDNNTIDPPKSP